MPPSLRRLPSRSSSSDVTISVIIPTAGKVCGDESLLRQALDAVEHADEVIVVVTDNEITDSALEDAEWSGAHIIHVDGDFNFSRAVNAAAEIASGNWLMLLNDDVSLPASTPNNWLAALARKRADVKGVCLISPDGWYVEHAGVWFEGPGGLPSHRGWHTPASVYYPDGPALAVTGAAMMIRRSTFDALGGFDEDFPLNYGDVDFCLRATKLGYRTFVYNSIRLAHREASTRGVFNPIPEFRLLVDHHEVLFKELGVDADPDLALHHLTHQGLLQAPSFTP